MTDFLDISYRVKNRVATISLNRPQTMNAFSQNMRIELLAATKQAENDEDVRVVVISAQGKGFSSGTDLSQGLAGYSDINEQIQVEYKPFLMAIADSKKLYISSVTGACAGIGVALALNCDYMVMADNAFLYMAFAAIGLVPDGGSTYHLIGSMGYKKALQLFVEAGRLTADEAEKYGLANKVVTADQLSAKTQDWAESLANLSPLSQSFGKKLFRSAMDADLQTVLDEESLTQVDAMNSRDHASAVKAFFAKEKASFIGK